MKMELTWFTNKMHPGRFSENLSHPDKQCQPASYCEGLRSCGARSFYLELALRRLLFLSTKWRQTKEHLIRSSIQTRWYFRAIPDSGSYVLLCQFRSQLVWCALVMLVRQVKGAKWKCAFARRLTKGQKGEPSCENAQPHSISRSAARDLPMQCWRTSKFLVLGLLACPHWPIFRFRSSKSAGH